MPKPRWKLIQENHSESGLDGVFLRVLGWQTPQSITGDETHIGHVAWHWRAVAKLQGAAIVEVQDLVAASSEEHLKLSRHLSKLFPELIVKFAGAEFDTWYWPHKLSAGGVSLEKIVVVAKHLPDFLAQRLAGLKFSDQDLATLTPAKVRDRLRGFVETTEITRQFYEKFTEQHRILADSIAGIHESHRPTYATVLLNRLMFLWFLQKKEFLNSDPRYLWTCLERLHEMNQGTSFYSFYRDYLLDLFFNYLNSTDHDSSRPEIATIIGCVPYINGGIFGKHDLEVQNQIDIPDASFVSIFTFFDSYTWHLDTRPTGESSEINPEVMGFIFEQYINAEASGKKQHGAYYTKPDVTGYITSHTLGMKLVDILNSEKVSAGLITSAERDSLIPQSFRTDADPAQFLPGENEIERDWRLDRSLEFIKQSGDIVDESLLTTENYIPLQYFLLVVSKLEDVQVIDNVLGKIGKLRVLDPACGSGAFLFAALEVLEVAIEALHQRLGDLGRIPEKSSTKQRYQVRKSIVLNNLFGVDVMQDAVETAKLRLFLALASCIGTVDELEPLPDLDFNLMCGNSLLGFVNEQDGERYAGSDFFKNQDLATLTPAIEDLHGSIREFHHDSEPSSKSALKSSILALQQKITQLTDASLSRLLASDSEPVNLKPLKAFHWFIAFHEVMANGGFDVVIGNPPYIQKRNYDTSTEASLAGYSLANMPDLYAPFLERIVNLTNPSGRVGAIVPISLCSGEKYAAARKYLLTRERSIWWSTYDQLPLGLFTPADVRNTIILLSPRTVSPRSYVSQHHVFTVQTRPWLFERIQYFEQPVDFQQGPIRSGIAHRIGLRLASQPATASAPSEQFLGFRPSANYWLPVLPVIPPILDLDNQVLELQDSRVLKLELSEQENIQVLLALCGGKIGFLWWQSIGDGMDVYAREFGKLRAAASYISKFPEVQAAASALYDHLFDATVLNSYRGRKYVNIRWPNLEKHTDVFDQAALAALDIGSEWPNLMIWYAQVMRSNDSRNNPTSRKLINQIWSR